MKKNFAKIGYKSWRKKDDKEIRYRFQVCINDNTRKHIGWCNAYCINDNYEYIKGEGHLTIGINIPDLASRRKGYATAAWDLFIQYLLSKGFKRNLYANLVRKLSHYWFNE